MRRKRIGILILLVVAPALLLLSCSTDLETERPPEPPETAEVGADAVPDGEPDVPPNADAGGAAAAAGDSPTSHRPLVRGRITTADGRPVRNASVAVDDAHGPGMYFAGAGPRIRWCEADENGAFEIELPALFAGRPKFEVLARAKGLASGVSNEIAVAPGESRYEVDLVLAAGASFTAIVTEEGTSVPVPGAALHVSPGCYERDFVHGDGLRTSNEPGLPTHLPPAVVSDEFGSMNLDDLVPGNHLFLVTAEGFDCRHLGWVTVPTKEPIRVELHRQPLAGIRGVVVYPDGAPVHWAQVVAVDADEGYWRGDWTGADGSFQIGGLPDGAHRLNVTPMGKMQFVPEDLDVYTGGGDVRFVVERGKTLHLRLVDPEGRPCENIEVRVHGSGSFRTDAEGRISVSGLTQKPYRLDLDFIGYHWGDWGVNKMNAEPGPEEITIVTPKCR